MFFTFFGDVFWVFSHFLEIVFFICNKVATAIEVKSATNIECFCNTKALYLLIIKSFCCYINISMSIFPVPVTFPVTFLLIMLFCLSVYTCQFYPCCPITLRASFPSSAHSIGALETVYILFLIMSPIKCCLPGNPDISVQNLRNQQTP